jgi:hypothetical protein
MNRGKAFAWTTGSLTAAIACFSGGPRHPEPRCPPIEAVNIARDSVGSVLQGEYVIEFVGTGGAGKGKRATGTLTLWERLDSLHSVAGLDGQPVPWITEPLFGTMTVDLEVVGAFVNGTVSSADPSEPGVVVRDYDYSRLVPPERVIRFDFGSGSNKRGLWILDGPYIDNEITVVGTTGLAGWWEASIGYTTYRSVGYFCARKVG